MPRRAAHWKRSLSKFLKADAEKFVWKIVNKIVFQFSNVSFSLSFFSISFSLTCHKNLNNDLFLPSNSHCNYYYNDCCKMFQNIFQYSIRNLFILPFSLSKRFYSRYNYFFLFLQSFNCLYTRKIHSSSIINFFISFSVWPL